LNKLFNKTSFQIFFMQIEQIFGSILKELRTEKKLSQEKLAEKSDLHKNYISLLETGQRQPTITTIFAIAKALGIKPEELVAKVNKEVSKSKK
jgi:transcriptional regulator with XRE-family HTH domain